MQHLRVPVRSTPSIDLELVLRKRFELFGGVNARFARAAGVDRATLGRWLKEGPTSEESCCQLSKAMDVDPLALWNFTADTFPRQYARLASFMFGSGLRALHEGLAFLDVIAKPSWDWPPMDHASRLGKIWQVEEFEHSPPLNQDTFGCFAIEGARDPRADPQTYYWAFRDSPPAHSPWRAYGAVVARRQEVTLLNFNGLVEAAPRLPFQAFVTRTWLGTGAAQFKVASIHSFRLSREVNAPADGPLVTFGYHR
jgi:hypothetical protein